MDDSVFVANDDVQIEDIDGHVNWENASDDLIAVEEPDTSLDESLPPTDDATTDNAASDTHFSPPAQDQPQSTEDLSATDAQTDEPTSEEVQPSGSYLTGGMGSTATTELGFHRRFETGLEMPEREFWGDMIEEENG